MKILLLLCTFFLINSYICNSQVFTEVASTAGINFNREYLYNIGGGISIIDYDNDGWEDLLLPGGYGSAALFKNNGDGTFTEKSPFAFSQELLSKLDSLLITSSIVGDIDNDGDKDVFFVTSGYKIHNGVLAKPHVLLENLGNGTFSDISNAAGIIHSTYGEAATMGDYNNDGFLDIYVSNYVQSMDGTFDNNGNQTGYIPECIPNTFYINNGDKTFTEAASSMGLADQGCTLTSSFTDFDFDHDVDILIANDFGEWNTYPNALFENNYPTNSFVSSGASSGFNQSMYGMGIAPGDYNEDGNMDYYVTNIGTNSLYKNNGDGTFTDESLSLGVDNTWSITDSLRNTSWGCTFLDIDNDTYLDLFVATGSVLAFIPLTTIKDSSRLYRNDGTGQFEDISVPAGVANIIGSRGSVSFDFDHDGDLDLAVNHAKLQIFNSMGITQNLQLYRNDNSTGNNWIKIKLQGTTNNRDAYGSRVKIFFGNRSLIREIDGGSSHASINSSIAHFGLGNVDVLDSIKVYWLGGYVQTIYNVDVNQTITIIEGETMGVLTPTNFQNELRFFPNPANASADITMNLISNTAQNYNVKISTIFGSEISNFEISATSGENQYQLKDWLDIKNFKSQMLIISITDKYENTTMTKVLIL